MDVIEKPSDFQTPELKDRLILSTPKPIIHLGTSTEFQRRGTPFKHSAGYKRSDGFKPTTNFKAQNEPKSAFRPATSYDTVNRPMTAVRGAGYTSHGTKSTDPLKDGTQIDLQRDSFIQKLSHQKDKIMQLIGESCMANNTNDHRKALTKAKEAYTKQKNLIKMQEQADMGDVHNVDLTYTVIFLLGNQYAINELYGEALSTYHTVIKNRMFSNAYHLKINMGNIYFKQNRYHMAIKMFRMALDQVSSGHKNLRIKIMHNISLTFMKMGQWEEAVSSLEYIMSEQACHRAGLHLVLCCRALDDVERMKAAFSLLLSVPSFNDNEDKYNLDQDNVEDTLIAMAIQNDDLHNYEMKKCKEADYCILTAAKLIAPLINKNFSAGYDWCVAAIKNSEYVRLAIDLEINKAVTFLKENQLSDAIDTLKSFEKDNEINAAINLMFIYFLQCDYENASKYADILKGFRQKDANAFVNLAVYCMFTNQIEQAINYLKTALDHDPGHFEAAYNLCLILKHQKDYVNALQNLQRFYGSLALLPELKYQIANLLELSEDREAASETYQELLGLVPSDAGVLQKIADLYDKDGDRQQAHHHHVDAFRCYPANLAIIDWLGSYYIEMQVVEKALSYFEKAVVIQPKEPKWNMMVAACHRRSGNVYKALTIYQDIHKEFPENVECLKFLAKLCNDLGMHESESYVRELKKLEKSKEVRERVNSSRPDSRRSNSSSRTSSGFSPVPDSAKSNDENRYSKLSKLMNVHEKEENDFGYTDTYESNLRPKTSNKSMEVIDSFANEDIGDDLLPE